MNKRLLMPAVVSVLVVTAGLVVIHAGSAGAIALPAGIPADCSRPVDADINKFIAGVPDGSIIEFAPGGCYAQDGQLEVNDRRNLTLQGNGASFRAVTPRSDGSRRANWAVQGGGNVVLRNMTVYGVYPEGEFDRALASGSWPYERRMDLQQGYLFGGVQGGGLYDAAAYNTFSDPVLVGWDVRPQIGTACTAPSRDVEIRRVTGVNSGRTVAIVSGERITLGDSFFGDIRDNAIDLETDAACSVLREIHVVDNRIGRHRLAAIAHTGSESGANSGLIEIRGNVQERDPTTCWPSLHLSPVGTTGRRGPYEIRGNRLRTLTTGILVDRAEGGTIADNTVEKSGGSLCSSAPGDPYYLAVVKNSRAVNVAANLLRARAPDPGFRAEVLVDGSSAAITHQVDSSPRTEAESLAAPAGCWSALAYGALSGGGGRNCYQAGIPLTWTVTAPAGGASLRLYGYRDAVARGFRVRIDGGGWTQGTITGPAAASALFFESRLAAGTRTVELEWVTSGGSTTFDFYELRA